LALAPHVRLYEAQLAEKDVFAFWKPVRALVKARGDMFIRP